MSPDSVAIPTPQPSTESTTPAAIFSLRFQLLLGVNVALVILLTLALIADYRRELAHQLQHEKAALLAEAETIAAALPALNEVNAVSIRRLLDSILTGMSKTSAPRHRIQVEWNGQIVESKSATGSPLRDDLARSNFPSKPTGDGNAVWETKDLVVGMCSKSGFVVHVAEPLEAIRLEIGYETLERLTVLVLAGLVAMGIVDFILVRALVRPMEHLSRTVEAIGNGKLGAQVTEYRTAELAVLAKSINRMSQMLAAHDREVHQQMSKARRLQQHLLPPWPTVAGLTTERRFLPATEVTGDYHEAFPLSNGEWLFCIADVTGHGIPAAMTAAMLKILFHQAVAQTHDPQQILTRLNSNFGAVVMPGDFATMLIVRWHPSQQRISFANGGHEPGMLMRKNGELVLLESDGLMVGAVPEAHWSLHTYPISVGDRLFMYTDGAVEVFNASRELFGRKRLCDAYLANRTEHPKVAVQQIIQCLDNHRGERAFSDDVTLLMMEFAAEFAPDDDSIDDQ